jgi:hypothetical protein
MYFANIILEYSACSVLQILMSIADKSCTYFTMMLGVCTLEFEKPTMASDENAILMQTSVQGDG